MLVKRALNLLEGAPFTDTDMAAVAIKSMAQNTNGNQVFSAKRWFDQKIITGIKNSVWTKGGG